MHDAVYLLHYILYEIQVRDTKKTVQKYALLTVLLLIDEPSRDIDSLSSYQLLYCLSQVKSREWW